MLPHGMQASASTILGLAGTYLQGYGKHGSSECKISTLYAQLYYAFTYVEFPRCSFHIVEFPHCYASTTWVVEKSEKWPDVEKWTDVMLVLGFFPLGHWLQKLCMLLFMLS